MTDRPTEPGWYLYDFAGSEQWAPIKWTGSKLIFASGVVPCEVKMMSNFRRLVEIDRILSEPCPYPGIPQFREGWECAQARFAAMVGADLTDRVSESLDAQYD